MRVLTVDIGTGTQDIFLYDSRLDLENGFKLVLPSPTMMVYRKIQEATRQRQTVVLNGYLMGGGPSQWAAENHLQAGLPVFATPEAALSFNDNLDVVRESGIQIISEDEALQITGDACKLELRDFDFHTIEQTFSAYGISLTDLAALAVAVFDHGAAPVGISDRQFRFDYLDQRIREENKLSAFAYQSANIPPIMTRLKSVAKEAIKLDTPLIVMDTAPAAIFGTLFDPHVKDTPRKLIVNVGNFHTLAFRLGPAGIEGMFEHHTGLVDQTKLNQLLERLASSTLKHEEVFNDHGHGALVYDHTPIDLSNNPDTGVIVTGPRRNMLKGSRLNPYFAVPFGDMMIAGCFGLLAATADILPELRAPITASLTGKVKSGTPPWEID